MMTFRPRPILKGMFAHMVRSGVVLLAAMLWCVLLSGGLLGSSLAGAQPTSTSTTNATATTPATAPVPVSVSVPSGNQVTPTPDIIPRPGQGREPRDPGDRGGWWQEALFFVMCGALLLSVGLIWRDARQARRSQGRLTPRRGPTTSVSPSDEHAEQKTH